MLHATAGAVAFDSFAVKIIFIFRWSIWLLSTAAREQIVIWLVLDLMKRFGVLSIQSFALFFENMHNDMRGKDARLIAKTASKVARALQLKSKYPTPLSYSDSGRTS